jgi:hypothetical protein
MIVPMKLAIVRPGGAVASDLHSLWLFGVYVQDVKRVLKFVRHFHSPFAVGRELAVYTLQYLPGRDGGFLPGSVLVRQFFANLVRFGLVVKDMEKISGHEGQAAQDAQVPI